MIVSGIAPRTAPHPELRNAQAFKLDHGDVMIGASSKRRAKLRRDLGGVIPRDHAT
jgi:hypothetical protein